MSHLLPLGQRKHIIEMYFRPLTLKRSIVKGGKHDRLIPMGTRVTPKPMVSLGKVWSFNLFELHVTHPQKDTSKVLLNVSSCNYDHLLLMGLDFHYL